MNQDVSSRWSRQETETLKNQVEALEKLAGDKAGQQELGRRLLQEVAQAVYEEKQNIEMSNPDFEMTVKKGDPVPDQLRDQVPTDAQGRAITDTLVQQLNLRIWFRLWIRFWLRIIFGTRFATTPLTRFQDFADRVRFSSEETELIERLRKFST